MDAEFEGAEYEIGFDSHKAMMGINGDGDVGFAYDEMGAGGNDGQ